MPASFFVQAYEPEKRKMHFFQRSAFSSVTLTPCFFRSSAVTPSPGTSVPVNEPSYIVPLPQDGLFDLSTAALTEKLCARLSVARAPFSNCSVTSAPVFETTLSPRRSAGVRGVGSPPQHSGMKNAKNNMKRGLAQNLDEPCLTVTSHLAKVSLNSRDPVLLVDPSKELYRRFTPREAARIQSFPETFTFAGSEGDAYRQIGNAVPPVLFWHIAKALGKQLAD